MTIKNLPIEIKYGDSFVNLGANLTDLYLNPNELGDMSDRLHVCESLFGDLNAKVMILLQDAADKKTLLNNASQSNPLIHGQKFLTNKRLVTWFGNFFKDKNIEITGANSKNCGIYYANAVWLIKKVIKKGEGVSSPIRKRKAVLLECQPVLDATIQNLKELKVILAFGDVAFEALALKFNIKDTWHEALANNKLIPVGDFLIGTLYHPANRKLSPKSMMARIHNYLTEAQL